MRDWKRRGLCAHGDREDMLEIGQSLREEATWTFDYE